MKGVSISIIKDCIVLADGNYIIMSQAIPPPMTLVTHKAHEWYMELSTTTVAVSFHTFRWVYRLDELRVDVQALSRTIETTIVTPLSKAEREKVIRSLTNEEKRSVIKDNQSLVLAELTVTQRTWEDERAKFQSSVWPYVVFTMMITMIVVSVMWVIAFRDVIDTPTSRLYIEVVKHYKSSLAFKKDIYQLLNTTLNQ